MKKSVILMMAAFAVAGCEKAAEDTAEVFNGKKVTFAIEGDFNAPTFTRSLMADGSEMSDVWVFDFVDGECVQTVHQEKTDADFGTPTVTLTNGEHELRFLVSRGVSPALNAGGMTIQWERPSDTFWGEKALTVGQGTAATVAVTLARVATKLKVVISDEVPGDIATLTATPATWYYGLNYWNGEPTVAKTNQARSVSVPASYVGTTGELNYTIFGLSVSEEWKTDVTVTATDADGAEIGRAVIADAPFMANRQTQYTGRLFSKEGGFTLTLDDAWMAGFDGEW